jgi:hypothetical protein
MRSLKALNFLRQQAFKYPVANKADRELIDHNKFAPPHFGYYDFRYHQRFTALNGRAGVAAQPPHSLFSR